MKKLFYFAVVSICVSVSVLFSSLSVANQESASQAEEIWSCDIREKKSDSSENFEPCFYGGAGLSISRLDPSRNNSSWSLYSRDDDGWNIYGGYHFKPDWFAEISYFDLGTVRVKDNNPNLNRDGTIRYSAPVAMVGYYFDLPKKIDTYIPELPVDFYVKLGLSALDTNPRPSNLPIKELSSIQLAGALGLEYRLRQHWKLRTEYKTFDIDAYAFNFSAAYIFGQKRIIQHEPEPTPEPTPEPEPEPIVVPEPVITAAVCKMFEGSFEGIIFKSGSDELTDSSKTNLQAAVVALREYETLELTIHAYTDSVGAAEFNLILSEKRAASVKRFLVEQGIDESRLSAQGFGEESPIADNTSAQGKALNRRVELQSKDSANCAAANAQGTVETSEAQIVSPVEAQAVIESTSESEAIQQAE